MEQTIQRVATQKIGNFSKATDHHHRDSIYEDAFWRNMEAFCSSGKLCMCIPFGLDTIHNDVGARWRAALFECSVIMMQQKRIDESCLYEMVHVFLAPPHKVSQLVLV
jgi:hypothetical protein